MRDAELFALKVNDRLDRGWSTRQLLIGAMGLAGGAIGSAQILGSGVLGQFQVLGSESGRYLRGRIYDLIPDNLLPAGFTLSPDILWMSAALAVVAIGLGVARAVREI